MKSVNPQAAFFLIPAFWIMWGFGYETVWARFSTEVDGTIISSRDVPSTGAPRYTTEYVVRSAEGHDFRYRAGATDASLERSIPVGSHITKKWGQLGYQLNGQWESFPIGFYAAMFVVAFAALSRAATLQWRSRE
jgi:hypothetical protein